jgi:hypothetical protein
MQHFVFFLVLLYVSSFYQSIFDLMKIFFYFYVKVKPYDTK